MQSGLCHKDGDSPHCRCRALCGGLLTNWFLGSLPQSLILNVWGKAWELACPTSSQEWLMLLVQGSHFKNHWCRKYWAQLELRGGTPLPVWREAYWSVEDVIPGIWACALYSITHCLLGKGRGCLGCQGEGRGKKDQVRKIKILGEKILPTASEETMTKDILVASSGKVMEPD